jgi:multiple antibiotic resistance protein
MHDVTEHVLSVFFAYLAIMNPVANTAVFVALVSDDDPQTKRETAIKALLVTFVIVALFAILGKVIFHFFGITLPALRVAGGILVFIIGYHMLHGESSSLHKAKGNTNEDIAISPLAVPILAGPGTIATTMSFSASGSYIEISLTVFVFAILCLITLASFLLGQRVLTRLGANGVEIITRLMGLILAVIGVQMFIAGVYGAATAYSG